MLAPPVRLRTLYVSVTVHSYNEKIWSLVVGKIPWYVRILLSVKTSALQYIYVLRLKLCYLWKHALQVQSWVSLNIEFRGQLVMQPLYVNVTFVSVKPLQHKTNSFVALNEIFCIFNSHCLRGSDFPTLFKGRCLSLFSNRWCNIPSWPLSCNWMLVIFIFSVIMGGGGYVCPSWSHVTSSLTGSLVFREELAIKRCVCLLKLFLYHAAVTWYIINNMYRVYCMKYLVLM